MPFIVRSVILSKSKTVTPKEYIDLSALAGCWSSFFIRNIIYIFVFIYIFLMCAPLITQLLWLIGRLGSRKPV